MSEENKSENSDWKKGCLGFVALLVASMAGAAALVYAAQWLFGY